jgi:hypothetical protein
MCHLRSKAQTPLVRLVVDLLYNLDLLYNNVQQIHNKSTTFRLSTTPHNISRHVKMLWTQQKIHNKSNQWNMAFDFYTTCRKAVQVEKLCTANPQKNRTS